MHNASDQFVAHFGTTNPFWYLSQDSNALKLSGEQDSGVVLAVALSSQQAEQLRALTGVTSNLVLKVTMFGEPVSLHLVGRKVDANTWGGTAAYYGDPTAVVQDLQKGLDFAEQIVSEVNSFVIILDSQGNIKRFNRRCEEMTGMREIDLVGSNAHSIFVPKEVRAASWENISGFFRNEQAYEVVRPVYTKSGVRMIHWRNKIVASGSGVAEHYLVCSGVDVTEELQAKERLEQLANTDVLTGLPNRHAIEERMAQMLVDQSVEGFGLLFFDLDNFKKVNDHYGHLTGDLLIQQVAKAVREVVPEQATVARLGGDEFLVLIPGVACRQMEATAERILARMQKPFTLTREDQTRAEVYSGCSIGIAMYPEHGATREDLVRSADTAMYVAKDAGRRTYRVFSIEMNQKIEEYMWLESNMRRALDENQFELHYQPKVSLLTGQVDSVEALVRWRHPERGLIPPNAFIPYAEESGLIVPLGKWVLWEAARQVQLWKNQGLNVRIAVNLSARQLKEASILEDVTHAILAHDIAPSLIDLELTESCLVEDEKAACRLMRLFRELGAQVHLDDFGTGYSSLSQLTRLPLDVLKLDGSFIKSIHTDAKAQALVRSMVAVGHELSLKIVAECVETEEQALFLRNIGVDCAQGWLYGKPMKAADFEAWFEAQKPQALRRVA
jgi:c-di-GMP phosphodiesterase Gmr